uniref:FCP1 homology domain-containing protein n=1 Tax=Arundo donax TaxID=35708 RepID=A0A0A9D7C0_ARUDO
MAHAKVRAKLVFRRPYCDDFLRFCFQNFELGIWSRKKTCLIALLLDVTQLTISINH